MKYRRFEFPDTTTGEIAPGPTGLDSQANFRLEEAHDPRSNRVNERELHPSSPCTF